MYTWGFRPGPHTAASPGRCHHAGTAQGRAGQRNGAAAVGWRGWGAGGRRHARPDGQLFEWALVAGEPRWVVDFAYTLLLWPC